MSFLFGSAPKAVQLPPTPTVSPTQENIINQLAGVLQQAVPQVTGTGIGGQIPTYPDQTVAPQTPGQLGIIQQLLGAAGGVSSQLPDWLTSAASSLPAALTGAAGYQAPQVQAPQTGPAPQVGTPQIDQAAQIGAAPQAEAPGALSVPDIAFSPDAPTINARNAFQQGVAQPLLEDFASQVVPSLNAGAGRSAGGIYSSDLAGATGQATKQLDRTLAQQGSLFELGAQQANQQSKLATNQLLSQIAQANQATKLSAGQTNVGADLSTRLANLQSTLGVDTANLGARTGADLANLQSKLTTGGQNLQSNLDTIMANLQSKLGTNQLNVGSALSGQGLGLQALGQLPGAISTGIGTQFAGPAGAASVLSSIFPTISTPQTTQEQGLQQLIDEITKGSAFGQNLEQIAAGLGTAGTVQNNAVSQGGSTGLIPGVLGGLAGNAGIGAGISSLLGGGSSGGGIGTLLSFLANPLRGIGVSDEEAKEDLKPVGRLDKSGLPIYTFRYKGEPEGSRRLGLVAQDVEDVYPHAVGQIGPFKAVNYTSVALAEAFPEAA